MSESNGILIANSIRNCLVAITKSNKFENAFTSTTSEEMNQDAKQDFLSSLSHLFKIKNFQRFARCHSSVLFQVGKNQRLNMIHNENIIISLLFFNC